MWYRWSQKTKFYPSNFSDPCNYIAGVQGLSRGEGNSHEGSMQSNLAKAMESAKEWIAQRSLWNSWSSPKVVITRDGNNIILIWESLHILVAETVRLTKFSPLMFHFSLEVFVGPCDYFWSMKYMCWNNVSLLGWGSKNLILHFPGSPCPPWIFE